MNIEKTIKENTIEKKCGLLTFHSAQNYGAFFQTYALIRALHKIGIETDVIDYRPNYLESQWFDKLKSIKITSPFSLRNLITKVWSAIDILLNYNEKKKINNLFLKAVSQYIPLSNKYYLCESDLKSDTILSEKYNIYITGSDQIWNSKLTGGHLDPVYFLSSVPKHKRRIAYSASMGDVQQPKTEDKQFHSLIQNFEYISLRENASIPYVQSSVDISVESTLDPTLLLDKNEWDNFACEPITHPTKFMVVYYFGTIGKSFISFSSKIAKQYNLDIVWISVNKCYFKYLRKYNFPSLEEFIWYFSHAEFILTDTYHGTVFSIINKKPFYTIIPRWEKIRITDLLERLGINNRCFETPSEIVEINRDIAYADVYNKLCILQKKSYQYLKIATEVE